jgi:hypothetical protein
MIIDAIGELIVTLWQADTEIRTRGILGEAEKSRRDRKIIAVVFTLLLVACAVLGVIFGI